MRIPNDYYMIVDLEATCSNVGTFPRTEMEIIEIGAVMLNSHTFEIESDFQSFVRPMRHPQLTAFCTELTNIHQDQVTDAPDFTDALDAMKRWMHGYTDFIFCSWGDYDKGQFNQDCEYHQVEYPFDGGHLNLKAEFSRSLGLKKKLRISSALRHVGLKFEGSQHRGLDDAKNIARIVRRVLIGV